MGANLFQKLPFFTISWPASLHFSSHKGEIWHDGEDLVTWDSFPQAKFCRNRLRRFWGL